MKIDRCLLVLALLGISACNADVDDIGVGGMPGGGASAAGGAAGTGGAGAGGGAPEGGGSGLGGAGEGGGFAAGACGECLIAGCGEAVEACATDVNCAAVVECTATSGCITADATQEQIAACVQACGDALELTNQEKLQVANQLSDLATCAPACADDCGTGGGGGEGA